MNVSVSTVLYVAGFCDKCSFDNFIIIYFIDCF